MTYDAIAVLTYGRGHTIGTDTLNALAAAGADMDRVHVFIGGNQDGYADAKDFHNRVHWHTAPPGYAKAQHTVWEHFPAGHRIIHCDDDIRAIQRLSQDGRRTEPETMFEQFATEAFDWADRERITAWGVSPSENPFYMAHRWRTGLYVINGQFFGYRNDPALRIGAPCKEDIEISLLHYDKAGAVGRINDRTVVVPPMRSNAGGLQADGQRDTKEHAATEYLLRHWPDLVHRKRDTPNYVAPVILRKPRSSK